MLHGWGMTSTVWDLVRPELESQFRVSWIDLPGYGKNSEVSADSISDISDLIISAMPEGSHLMGWSLGGLICQAIAEKCSVKSMTLVTSTPRFSQADDWAHAMSQDVLNKFSENLSSDIEGTLKRFIALQFMGVKEAKSLQRELTDKVINSLKSIKSGGGVSYKALGLGLEILSHSDYRQLSHQAPEHWLFAERDRLIPAEVINDLKLIRPDAQITLLKNAGHAPFMTHPDEFIASVIPFIKYHAG